MSCHSVINATHSPPIIDLVCIVCTPPPFSEDGGGALKLLPNFQKREIDRTLIFRGGSGGGEGVMRKKGGVTFLRGGLQFLCKK